MTNLAWYICLAGVSFGIALCIIYLKRDDFKVSTLVVFYLFVSAATWIGEFIVLGLFNAYAYKTGLFHDIWAQNLLAHLLLNTTMFPAAAIATVAYRFRYRGIFLVAIAFVLIEYLFIRLGIFEQHWWRYYMSLLNVIVFILVSRKWFAEINHIRSGTTRAITFYFVALIIIHMPAPILLLSGKQHYQSALVNNIFGDLYRSSVLITFTFHLIESFILVLFTCILKKRYWRVAALLVSPISQIIFAKTNILIIDDRWNVWYTVIIYEIFVIIFLLVEKYTLQTDKIK